MLKSCFKFVLIFIFCENLFLYPEKHINCSQPNFEEQSDVMKFNDKENKKNEKIKIEKSEKIDSTSLNDLENAEEEDQVSLNKGTTFLDKKVPYFYEVAQELNTNLQQYNKLKNMGYAKYILTSFFDSLSAAEERLARSQEKFNKVKDTLKEYYSKKYNDDLVQICEEAKKYFEKVPVKGDSLIVFDIDDTSLLTYPFMSHHRFSFIFSNNEEEYIKFYEQWRSGIGIRLSPVFAFYNYLLNKGFKIVFLSSRDVKGYYWTKDQLKSAGYTKFEEIILRPVELKLNNIKEVSTWKYNERKKLTKNYNIVGCVGDRQSDCNYGHTGYFVKLPNYLYA